ncbi:MAG: hypothetical protein EPO11_05330 [Gammaproteobacteria bacterium]|nr:MAG: hypothetical protein EPO11_05330 [Gammaproteobacteria bacterium]
MRRDLMRTRSLGPIIDPNLLQEGLYRIKKAVVTIDGCEYRLTDYVPTTRLICKGGYGAVYRLGVKVGNEFIPSNEVIKVQINVPNLKVERESKITELAGFMVEPCFFAYREDLYYTHYSFIPMEYVPGECWIDIVNRDRTNPYLSIGTHLRIMEKVLEDYINNIYKKGIEYRDAKLDNTIVDIDSLQDPVCVRGARNVDFGLSTLVGMKKTVSDINCGSKDYVAPEIVKGIDSGAKREVYSYGICFRLELHDGALESIIDADRMMPESKKRLLSLVEKMTASEPEDRPEPEAVLATLRELQEDRFYTSIKAMHQTGLYAHPNRPQNEEVYPKNEGKRVASIK